MALTYFPSLRCVGWDGIREAVLRNEAALLQDSIKVLIRQGKLELGKCKSFLSLCLTAIKDLQLLLQLGSSFAASSDSLTANPVRNLSVVGALSQTFSIPSVSGPAFQVYGYHIDHALPNVSKVSDGGFRSSVAASRSTAGFGESYFDGSNSKHGQLLLLPYSASNSDKDRSAASHRQAGMLYKNQRKPHNAIIKGYLLFLGGNRLCC